MQIKRPLRILIVCLVAAVYARASVAGQSQGVKSDLFYSENLPPPPPRTLPGVYVGTFKVRAIKVRRGFPPINLQDVAASRILAERARKGEVYVLFLRPNGYCTVYWGYPSTLRAVTKPAVSKWHSGGIKSHLYVWIESLPGLYKFGLSFSKGTGQAFQAYGKFLQDYEDLGFISLTKRPSSTSKRPLDSSAAR